MGAPIGNKFWELRSKHGRDRLFKTPALLWEAATEYFNHTDSRKWIKKDWVGKDAFEVIRETETPYTLSGLCLYLDCDRNYFNQFKRDLNLELKRDKDFYGIISRIEQIMFTQKFEGASVGAFNANIISRELGLVDKQEVENKGTSVMNVVIHPPLPDDE
jgi:hypothetical protein